MGQSIGKGPFIERVSRPQHKYNTTTACVPGKPPGGERYLINHAAGRPPLLYCGQRSQRPNLPSPLLKSSYTCTHTQSRNPGGPVSAGCPLAGYGRRAHTRQLQQQKQERSRRERAAGPWARPLTSAGLPKGLNAARSRSPTAIDSTKEESKHPLRERRPSF